MKYTITISMFLMLFVNTAVAATYTATVPKDLDVTTPTEGSTPPREMNDSVREVKVVEKNQYTMLSVGTNTTLTGTSTFIIGSSSTALTLNFPTASTIATSTCTKEYVILNRNTGTVTLNVAVEGITGSPTVSQNGGILLYTDGTTWFEKRVQNAYNATNFGNIGTSSFARSGANSDITAITGLTTYLAVGQGGSGTNTAAGAASAFGVGTEDTPTLTGVVATGSSTLTTLNSTTGNVTNLSTTTGTVTTLYSTTGNITNQTTTTGTITTLYNTTGNVTNLVTTTGTVTTLNSTTSNITTGNITNQVTTTGTVTTLHSTTGNVTNLNTTTGTVTTLNSTTGNITNQVTTTGTITTLNNTNLTTTTGTITTLNNTNLSGGSGTFTGNVQAASATGFDFLKQWAVGSTVGTGNVTFVESTGIDLTATYSNGVGTITITGVGTASAGGWTDTGTQTMGLTGNQVLPGGTLTIHSAYGITGLTDAWIPNTITLDNLTQITTRNYADLTGTATISPTTATITTAVITNLTATTATATTAVITNLTATNGTITNLYGASFDDIAGLPSDNTELAKYIGVDTLLLPGTTTPLAGTGTPQRIYNLVRYGDTILGTNTTALMTSDTAPSPNVVSVSTENPDPPNTMQGYRAFDRLISGSNRWLANATETAWISYEYGAGNTKRIDEYRIACAETSYAPKAWTFEGSNNGSDWTVLDTQTNQTVWTTSVYRNYIPTVTGLYRYYRVNISISQGSGYVGFSEVMLLESDYNYTYNTFQIIPPGTTTPALLIVDDGTKTTDAYLLADVKTSIFGLGTTTEIIGTATLYAGWFDGAVRATSFNVASSEKIKENIKQIKISPDMLDAEAEAKAKYIADNKSIWIASNRSNYESVVAVTGTGTVIWTDTEAMEAGYNNYIEIQWASDLNKSVYTENVQKRSREDFWQKFNALQSKSWNPKDKPNLTRRGFVVEEVPDEFKGDDKQSIDPMAVIAYQQKVLQSMKAEIESLTIVLENLRVINNLK